MNLSSLVPHAYEGREGRLDRFVEAARSVAATVECVARSAELIAIAVTKAAPEAKRIVIAESHDVPDELFALCRKLPGAFTDRSRRAMAAADVGVTDAFAAIATTGTVCVRVDAGITGYVSLLARTH